MSAGPNGPCPYLGEPSVTRTRTRVLPFISRLPEPLGWVCVYYFRGCQSLWARPLHSHHILLRGYRLLVPSRPGLITYHIQVQYPLYPVYTGTPTNGERLCGLLYHMCSCEVTKAQTLWEVETAADTIQTMVLYLDGLHQTTSKL